MTAVQPVRYPVPELWHASQAIALQALRNAICELPVLPSCHREKRRSMCDGPHLPFHRTRASSAHAAQSRLTCGCPSSARLTRGAGRGARARLAAEHHEHLVVREQHEVRRPGQHAPAHVQALEREHHLARVVRLRRGRRLRARLRAPPPPGSRTCESLRWPAAGLRRVRAGRTTKPRLCRRAQREAECTPAASIAGSNLLLSRPSAVSRQSTRSLLCQALQRTL